jgi:hypothetical protein
MTYAAGLRVSGFSSIVAVKRLNESAEKQRLLFIKESRKCKSRRRDRTLTIKVLTEFYDPVGVGESIDIESNMPKPWRRQLTRPWSWGRVGSRPAALDGGRERRPTQPNRRSKGAAARVQLQLDLPFTCRRHESLVAEYGDLQTLAVGAHDQ